MDLVKRNDVAANHFTVDENGREITVSDCPRLT